MWILQPFFVPFVGLTRPNDDFQIKVGEKKKHLSEKNLANIVTKKVAIKKKFLKFVTDRGVIAEIHEFVLMRKIIFYNYNWKTIQPYQVKKYICSLKVIKEFCWENKHHLWNYPMPMSSGDT